VVNRSALLLKYKTSAIAWINAADPYNDDPGVTIDSVNQERTVYLISDADSETDDAVKRWIKRNYKELFEEELEGWYTVPDLWPEKRTLKLFNEWFDVECHTVLIDTVDGAIYDDDI